ncbi:MAG: hypothetical protein M0C28_19535 [Candidatus Moduliflexus flocculans]|nr:hypothetical protein [Candidatus Moduliflexus flocculans]
MVQESNYDSAKKIVDVYRKPKSVDEALEAMKKFWDGYLNVLQVETPDAAFNSNVNIHNPHQCHTTRQWSRYLSYYQLGMGARGIGMRDSSQDLLGTMANDPQDAKEFLKLLLRFQRQNGSAFHFFNPLTLEGSEGDSARARGPSALLQRRPSLEHSRHRRLCERDGRQRRFWMR